MNGGGCGRPGWALAALFISVTLLVVTFRGASSSQKMTQTAVAHATATAARPGPSLTDDLLSFQAAVDFFSSEHAHVWLFSLVGSVAVGLSGIFPLLVIPIEAGAALKTEGKCDQVEDFKSRLPCNQHKATRENQEYQAVETKTSDHAHLWNRPQIGVLKVRVRFRVAFPELCRLSGPLPDSCPITAFSVSSTPVAKQQPS